jgi:uncharacterized protein YfdQ (DUF2303 family)
MTHADTYTAAAVDSIINVAQQAAECQQLEPGRIYAFVAGGEVHRIDLTGDAYADTPRRKVGKVVVADVPSFAHYYAKHVDRAATELYASRDSRTITAVIDAHSADVPGWAGHRLVLGLQHSEAFKAWQAHDGRYMDQEAFAEFLDDNRADIVDPSAAEMLEIAQTIQGTSKVDWQAGHRLRDGQRVLGYVETNTATAGTKGELAIPSEISLGVAIFDGAKVRHELTARFRHRIEGGKLRLMYKLDRPADVVTAAFDGVVAEVEQACGTTVMRGTPA